MSDAEKQDISAEARRFLEELRDRPFLALVLDGKNGVKLYTKDISAEEIDRVKHSILGYDEED